MRPVPAIALFDHQAEDIMAWRDGARFIIDLWHRGAGKGMRALAQMVMDAYQHPAAYGWVGATAGTVRESVWDATDAFTGRPYLDLIPAELIADRNENEMAITMRTKIPGLTSRLLFKGAWDADKLRGVHPRGIVLDEYATHDSGAGAYDVLRPAITRTRGWMLITSTPKGRSNHFAQLVEKVRGLPDWRLSVKTIQETHDLAGAPLIAMEDVALQRREGQHEAWLRQEYFCEFTTALVSSYYGDLLDRMQAEGRIGAFPHDPGGRRVTVSFDLGVANPTVATFAQTQGGTMTLLDVLAMEGLDIAGVVRQVRQHAAERGYDLGHWLFPHDVAARGQTGQSATGKAESRADVLKRLGVRYTKVEAGPGSLADGIDATRRFMASRMRINRLLCAKTLEALEGYEKHWDPKAKVFRETPKHSWHSDYADSVRYLCLGWTDRPSFEERRESYDRQHGRDGGPRAITSTNPDGRRPVNAWGDPE